MNCKQAEKLLVEFLYRELSAKKTVEVEKHLQGCDRCTRTLENWQAIHRGYRKGTAETEAPPYLKQRILVAAREELERKPSAWEKFAAVLKPAIVMPVIFFVVLALFVTRNQEEKLSVNKPQAVGGRERSNSIEIANLRDGEEEKLKRASKTKNLADEKERYQTDKLDARKDLPERRLELSKKQAKEADQISGYGQVATEQSPEVAPESQSKEETKSEKNAELAGALKTAPAAAPPAVQEPKSVNEPNDAGSSFQEAQYWFKNNQLSQGKIAADQAIGKDKSRALASQFHQAGIVYQQNKEPQQAIVQYNLVLNNYPDYSNASDVLLRLGDSYAQIGQYENAIKAYEQLARVAGMKSVATQRLSEVQNKLKVQRQLRSLGYVNQ